MFRLSRDVRFAVDLSATSARGADGRNGYAGKPPVTGIGQCYYRLTVTVAGTPDPATGYLVNIKSIDEAVRDRAIPIVKDYARSAAHRGGGGLILACHRVLADAFLPHRVEALQLHLSPFTCLATRADLLADPAPMVLLHHSFEFAASHRLHNPDFSDEENRAVFGKCNNPHGHGHNYVLRVTLRGRPGEDGVIMPIDALEQIVDEVVIEPFDHRHLNLEVPEFTTLNPSVENIARVVFDRLRGPVEAAGGLLDAVTVWETPKTWCEYRGD